MAAINGATGTTLLEQELEWSVSSLDWRLSHPLADVLFTPLLLLSDFAFVKPPVGAAAPAAAAARGGRGGAGGRRRSVSPDRK